MMWNRRSNNLFEPTTNKLKDLVCSSTFLFAVADLRQGSRLLLPERSRVSGDTCNIETCRRHLRVGQERVHSAGTQSS